MNRHENLTPDWIDGETKVYEAPADHDDELRLWLRLFTCSTLVENEIRRRLREEFDFTLPRFDLLAQLDKAENGLVLGEISRRMMVSPGNLTALVERLVASGHISRTPLPTDKRVQIIALTPFGRKTFRRMADRHGDWISSMFAGVSQETGTELMKHLAALKRSVQAELAGPKD